MAGRVKKQCVGRPEKLSRQPAFKVETCICTHRECQAHTLKDLFIDYQKPSLQTMPRFMSDKGFSLDIAVQLGIKMWLFSIK